MSKRHFHGNRTIKITIFTLLGISALTGLTVYAVSSQVLSDYILKIAGSYANVENIKDYYDQVADEKQLSADGKKDYYSTISKVHRGVADIHMQIANYADERYEEAGGMPPPSNSGSTNSGSTSTGSESTGSTQDPITNSFLQVQFYGVPYGANSRGTLTRGKDYDGYYGLSNRIPEDGPFVCKAWYSTNKDKTRGREINFRTDNSVSNTSAKKTDSLMMKIDFATDVTETLLKVTCSGTMGGSWKTLEYNETFSVVSPAKAVIAYFRISNTNPAPNESLTFSWQTTGAVGCSLVQLADGGVRFSLPGQVANGTYNRNADSSGRSTYRLICTNGIGEDTSAPDVDVAVQTPGTGTGNASPSCGTSNGQNFVSAPNTNLCTLGTAYPSPASVDPANSSKWKWSCSLGSIVTTCSANKTTTTQTGATTSPQCGNANSTPSASAPTAYLCNYGNPQPTVPTLDQASNTWKWNCATGAATVVCSAPKSSTTQTGSTQTGTTNSPQCGAVTNGSFLTAPTAPLCNIGSPVPTIPTLNPASNKWTWSCASGGQTVGCTANKASPTANLGQFAFSPQCADAQSFISLGGMAATYGTSSVSTNYTPTQICRIPTNTPSNIFNFLTDLVEPIDTNGADGYFDWGCFGISPNGVVDEGSMVTCSARKLIDAQCGPYANVARTTFDELSPGIRGSAVPASLNSSYCSVGTAMHENGSVALDNSDFSYFHWECRTQDLYKTCKAPYQQSKTINLTASKTTLPTAGGTVTFDWSLPINTAYVVCYPVTDYRAQGNAVYNFYNSLKARQGTFTQAIDKTTVVSLYCAGKTADVSDKKDIVITVGDGGGAGTISCPSGTSVIKSADGQNSCNFAWGQTPAGKSASGVSTTGGGVLTGVCGSTGNWSTWTVTCPNKTTTVSCPGGGATFYSNDQSNTCVATIDQKNAGQSATIGNGLTISSNGPAATGSASCKANGTWGFNINCPSTNTTIKTCPGGSEPLPSPSGNKTCVASWNITNAGNWVNASVNNGGSLRAYCDANGNWSESTVTWSCPD